MNRPTSYFDRIIASPRRLWLKIVFILLLFGLPLVTAFAEGSLGELFAGGAWRGIVLPPVVIAYILLVSPGMGRMEAEVLESFRSLVLMDEESFNQLADQVGRINPRNEIVVFGVGALLGILITFPVLDQPASFSWLILEWFVLNGLEYGLLAWVIYGSLVGTRLTAAMLRQSLRVDPLDISPFEPIGRQSLLLALVFVGGIVLSLLFVGIRIETLQQASFWLLYIPILSIPVIIFFLSMNPTHKVLAACQGTGVEGRARALRSLLPGVAETHRSKQRHQPPVGRDQCPGGLHPPPANGAHLALQHIHAAHPFLLRVDPRWDSAGEDHL